MPMSRIILRINKHETAFLALLSIVTILQVLTTIKDIFHLSVLHHTSVCLISRST